jgi:diguanylate cyclase (GGDEF)-like protein
VVTAIPEEGPPLGPVVRVVPLERTAGVGVAGEGTAAVADDSAGLLRVLAPVLDLVGRMNGGDDSTAALQALLEAVTAATGFGAGAINYVRSDGTMAVIAVAGPQSARDALLGVEVPPGALDEVLSQAERRGRLRLLSHEVGRRDADYVWVPDLPEPDDPDGWHPRDSLLAPLHDDDERLIGVLSVDLPVGGRRPCGLQLDLLDLLAGQTESALRNARRSSRLRAGEESFRVAFEATAVGTGLVSLDGRDPMRLLMGNRALGRIAEAAGAAEATVLSDLLDPADPDRDPRRWRAAICAAPDGFYRAEKQLRGDADGDRPWVQVLATVLPVHATEASRAIVQVEDVTERRRAQGDLHLLATSDPLTALPNRARFDEEAGALVTGGAGGAVLFCDLDDFKTINDVFGHLAGDAVLRACARRLADTIRPADTVFRLGGDEFVVLMPGCPEREADEVADRIRKVVAEPVEHEGRRLTTGISVGVAAVAGEQDGGKGGGPAGEDGSRHDGVDRSVRAALAAADAAMYADKRRRTARPGAEPA